MLITPPHIPVNIQGIDSSVVKSLTIALGAWDMDTVASITVETFVSRALVLGIDGIIYPDDDARNIAPYPLLYGDSTGIHSWWHYDESAYNTSIVVYRTALGLFDSLDFNDGVKNRGYLRAWCLQT